MTKFKKLFLTCASALCCLVCSALAVLGITSKNTVFADTTQYETATVYDVSQLSSSGPSTTMGDLAWFEGKAINASATAYAFDYRDKGYTGVKTDTAYTPKSVGVTFKMSTTEANKWSADNKQAIRLFLGFTEVRWYYRVSDGGFKFEIYDWAESTPSNKLENIWYETNFDSTVERTYTAVKSMVVGSNNSYKVEVFIDGTLEYVANCNNMPYDAPAKTWHDRFLMQTASTTDIIVKSAYANAVVAKDIYDYKNDEAFLKGKAFASTDTANFDVLDRTGLTDVSADSFGVTFKTKFDSEVVAGKEVLRARIGATYDARLSIVTAGANGRAQINVFDWRDNSNTNKILGVAAAQFNIDLTKEHTYTFIKEKIKDTTSAYVYSAYVDGTLIQRAIYNLAPAASWGGSNDYSATNRMRIMVQGGASTGTFRSAKYYGVKVDGVMNKVNVGENYTLTKPQTDKLFFGFKDTQGNVYNEDATINAYTELNSILVDVHNSNGAYVRFLSDGTANLKWLTYINKADLAALQTVFGTDNVTIYRKVKTANDTSKEIKKQVAIADMAVNATEYSFAQILSEIKQSHYGWEFVYSVCVEVKDNDGNVLFEVEVANEGRSIAGVAEAAYNDVKTAEEYNALSDAQKALYKYEIEAGKYSQYSNAQRAILKGYFTVS